MEYRNGLGNIHGDFDGGHYPALMFVGDQTFLIRFLLCFDLAAPFLVGARGFYIYENMFYRSFVGAGLGVGLAEIPEGAAGLLLRRVFCLGQLLVLDICLMWTTYWLVTILHTDCSHLPGGGLILPLRPWLGLRHL